MNESELTEIPAAQASKALFPPGCFVWIHSDEDGIDDASASSQHQEYVVREGKVKSVYMGDVFSVLRKFYYKIEVTGGDETELVEESNMSFAKNTPVFVADDNTKDSLPSDARKGEVLTSMWYANNASGKGEIIYSLIVFTKGEKLVVKHGVRSGQLRFRPIDVVPAAPSQGSLASVEQRVPSLVESNHDVATVTSDLGSLISIDQRAPGVDSKAKLPPPGFLQMAPKESPHDDSFGIASIDHQAPWVDSKAKQLPPPGFLQRAPKESSEDGSFVLVGSKNKKTPLKQKRLQIPSWLVANDSSRNQVIDTLNQAMPSIFQATGCVIVIDEPQLKNRNQLGLTLNEHVEKTNNFTKSIEMVENCLVQYLGAEEACGRFLYDMAKSYGNARPDGTVFQRNPLNSRERVWMCVVELPAEVHDGKLMYLAFPLLDGKTYDNIHQVNCTLKVCRDSFGIKLFRCRPYVLIMGKQTKNVSQALLIAKNTLKMFKQNKMSQLVQPQVITSMPPSRCDTLPDSNAAKNKVPSKPRIIAIPGWLMSDVSFQSHIQDGLFGHKWCQEMEVGETGCDIILTQNHFIVTSKHGQGGKSISKATDMIEDALVGLIGAQESKCRLLYDLTESYSELWLDGVIQMRNPLNSDERIWASLIDLPMVMNKEGGHHYLLPPFMSKESDVALHSLKCTVKICADNFEVNLDHCQPYAMIMGRQKKNVGKAMEFIRKAINNCQ